MWRFYLRELPAILVVLSLVTGGLWITWALRDPVDQKPSTSKGVIVNLWAPNGRTAWARRDPSMGAAVRLADGSQHAIGIPMSLAQNCRVGDRVTLRVTVSNAGARHFGIASVCVRSTL